MPSLHLALSIKELIEFLIELWIESPLLYLLEINVRDRLCKQPEKLLRKIRVLVLEFWVHVGKDGVNQVPEVIVFIHSFKEKRGEDIGDIFPVRINGPVPEELDLRFAKSLHSLFHIIADHRVQSHFLSADPIGGNTILPADDGSGVIGMFIRKNPKGSVRALKGIDESDMDRER